MAVDFMADMIQHSTIATSDVETERNVILEEINMRDDDPGDLIHDVFAETLWRGHPLGRPVLGTREAVTSASRDQIKRMHDLLYRPPHVVIPEAGHPRHEQRCSLLEGHIQ